MRPRHGTGDLAACRGHHGMSWRVLIVDDSPQARTAIRTLLANEADFTVVGEAEDGDQAVAMVSRLEPDLVLMDLRMPRCDGFLATSLVLAARPRTTVVVLTVSVNPADLFEAMRRGARGYLVKHLSPADWLRYLRAFASGEVAIPDGVAARILQELQAGTPAGLAFPELSERETEVLSGVALGRTNREVADTLCISEATVKTHLRN